MLTGAAEMTCNDPHLIDLFHFRQFIYFLRVCNPTWAVGIYFDSENLCASIQVSEVVQSSFMFSVVSSAGLLVQGV